MNISQIQQLGDLWGSGTMESVAESFAVNSSTANAGDINGNRMFYANDYMVSYSRIHYIMMFVLTPKRLTGATRSGVRDYTADVLESHHKYGMCQFAECTSFLEGQGSHS